jgi:hypothetical protein
VRRCLIPRFLTFVSQRTLLAAHEGRFDKRRKTKRAEKATLAALEEGFEPGHGLDGALPGIPDDDEIEQLEIELSDIRRGLQGAHSKIGKPLRAIMIELNGELLQGAAMMWQEKDCNLVFLHNRHRQSRRG